MLNTCENAKLVDVLRTLYPQIVLPNVQFTELVTVTVQHMARCALPARPSYVSSFDPLQGLRVRARVPKNIQDLTLS